MFLYRDPAWDSYQCRDAEPPRPALLANALSDFGTNSAVIFDYV